MSNIYYRRNDRFAPLADKVAVRDYVESKGLGHILTELYGVWNSASEIDFDRLPERFVLKANHGCNFNLVCRDKSSFDIDEARRLLDGWLTQDYGWLESHYSLIPPKILGEEFVDDGVNPEPLDYKFLCIHGEPFVVIHSRIYPPTGTSHFYVYTPDGNHLSDYYMEKHPEAVELGKPRNFDKMAEYARILARDFELVRVDFFDTGDKVYFSELTFTPECGVLDSYTDEGVRKMYEALKG
jgi:hypothetical protein